MNTLTQDKTSTFHTLNVQGAVAEQYHALVHWLRSGCDTSTLELKTIGVTSCTPGAGVSTVASDLAIAAAQVIDHPVLLVDLSTTRPTLSTRFAMSGDLGLCDALAEGSWPIDCVKPSPIANLSLLAGGEPGDANALSFDCRRVGAVLQALEHDFRLIVVDLPTTESGLCFAAAGLMDGVLLVMEAERTPGDIAVRANRRLVAAQVNVLGVILNKQRQHIPDWLNVRL